MLSDDLRSNSQLSYKEKLRLDAEKFRKKRMSMIMLAKQNSLPAVAEKIQKEKEEAERAAEALKN